MIRRLHDGLGIPAGVLIGKSAPHEIKSMPEGFAPVRSGGQALLPPRDRAINVSMRIRPIKCDRDYRKALKEIDGLMDARPNTVAGDHLDVLITLVEAWEEKHWPIESPDPVEAILFAIEQRGLSRRDLEPFIGSRARVSEVLNHKRSLTLPMIRRLHDGLGIPADVLIGESAAA
jgi:HTH-type transcriptional regulator/antitoxin HigA